MLKMKGKKSPPLQDIKIQRVPLKILNYTDKSKFTNLFSCKMSVYVCLLKYFSYNKYTDMEFYQYQPITINYLPQQLNSSQNFKQHNQAYKFRVRISKQEVPLILTEIRILSIQYPWIISVTWYNLVVASEKVCSTDSISESLKKLNTTNSNQILCSALSK